MSEYNVPVDYIIKKINLRIPTYYLTEPLYKSIKEVQSRLDAYLKKIGPFQYNIFFVLLVGD